MIFSLLRIDKVFLTLFTYPTLQFSSYVCCFKNVSVTLPLWQKLLSTQNNWIYVPLYACVLHAHLHDADHKISLHNHAHRGSLPLLCVRVSNVTLVYHRLWIALALRTLCICFPHGHVSYLCAFRDGLLTRIYLYKVHRDIHMVLAFVLWWPHWLLIDFSLYLYPGSPILHCTLLHLKRISHRKTRPVTALTHLTRVLLGAHYLTHTASFRGWTHRVKNTTSSGLSLI